MREIKFQVLLDNKIVGYERLKNEGWEWMWLDLNPDKGERWISGVLPTDAKAERSISNVVRRQFAGLHDKNWKEIYEGDIWEYKGEKWKISWSNEAALFWLQPTDKKGRRHIPPMNYLDRGVLIGNIFENPELLQTPNPKL